MGHRAIFFRVVLLNVLGAAPSTFIAFWVTQRFANSGDEYSYLLQAQIFAEGALSFESAAPESIREAFALDHVVDDGRVRSKYPPGWPALLAIGVVLGQAEPVTYVAVEIFAKNAEGLIFEVLRAVLDETPEGLLEANDSWQFDTTGISQPIEFSGVDGVHA